jgi:anti-anti-sigma regulatory factor
MPDLDAGVRVLCFSEPLLTAHAVARIAEALRDEQEPAAHASTARERGLSPVVLDCAALAEVSAAGLSALLELGRSNIGMRELALSGLTRALTLTAVQAGLSERFTLYTTREAAVRDLREPSGPT